MKKTNIVKNPYFLFFPFLIIALAIALIFKTNGSIGDEPRYLNGASNLLRGFYSPPAPDISLVNGPGYSIFLMPFLALHLPLISITIMNALLFYFSIILIYKTLQCFISDRIALIISMFWGCFINAYQNLPLIHPEALTLFLVALIIFTIAKAFSKENASWVNKYLLLSGFSIGYLILTKVIFGYVMLFMLSGSVLLWIFKRKLINQRKGVIILLISLAVNIPYLIYTYHLTDKILYWSSVGGLNLFWTTSPFEGEYGDYQCSLRNLDGSLSSIDQLIVDADTLKANFLRKYEEIGQCLPLEQDSAYKHFAFNNIKSYPAKFFLNCFCNVGRLIFDLPYTNRLQEPKYLLKIPLNGIIVVFIMIILIPTLINWRKIPYSIRFLIFFALLYFGGSIIGCSETRMFTPIVPILLLWIAFVITKMIKINMKF